MRELAGAPRRLDERSEQGELLGVAVGHSLGVPLDREEEAALPFDRLDDSIGSNGAHRETGREIADDLVVGAGHGQLAGADNGGEAGTRRGGNRMRRLAAPFTRAHMRRVGPRAIGEVLVEGASQRHVEDLEPATDSEEREVAGAGRVDQLHLKAISLFVDLPAALQDDLPVEGRVNVGASRQDQAVDRLQVLLDQCRPASARLSAGFDPSTGLRTQGRLREDDWKDHRQAARLQDGARIAVQDCLPALLIIPVVPARNPDPRSHVTLSGQRGRV